MHYWISNLYQSWEDLRGMMLFAPLIAAAFSIVIFIWSFKVLLINATNVSVQEHIFKLFISLYTVGCCWGIAFAFCVVFVSPVQLYNQQSETLAQLASSTTGQNFHANPADGYTQKSRSR